MGQESSEPLADIGIELNVVRRCAQPLFHAPQGIPPGARRGKSRGISSRRGLTLVHDYRPERNKEGDRDGNNGHDDADEKHRGLTPLAPSTPGPAD
jgi:hypothetical protein